tara:strand:- start:64 stop:366 length:303 start_codon:yes stop_codon:yes gene_type:complete
VTPDSNDYMPVMYRTRLVDAVTHSGEFCMEHKIKVQIADRTGHTQELEMSPADTAVAIQQNSSAWIYADNRMVQPNQMDEANLSTVSSVRILPGLVGGQN